MLIWPSPHTCSYILRSPVLCQREDLRRVKEVRTEKQRGAFFRGEATLLERSDTRSRNVCGGYVSASSDVIYTYRLLKFNYPVGFSHNINTARYQRDIAFLYKKLVPSFRAGSTRVHSAVT